MSLLEKIDEIIAKNNNNRHSYFQLKHFVIGKELTHQGRLHSCVMELSSRKNSMESLALEIQEQTDLIEMDKIEIKLINLNLDVPNNEINELNNQKKQIQIKRIERAIDNRANKLEELKNKLKGLNEEALYFLTIYEQLSKIEALRDWDDPSVQQEYWGAKFLEELNTRFLLGLQIDTELVKSIGALPSNSEAKVKLIEFLQEKVKLLQQR